MTITKIHKQKEMSDELPIVTFGKYKDKPLSELLADKKYIDWCMQQPWFIEKHKPIYNIIMNINPNTDTPTPEHNRLQNLFLQDEFTAKFACLFLKSSFLNWREYNAKSIEERMDLIKEINPSIQHINVNCKECECEPNYICCILNNSNIHNLHPKKCGRPRVEFETVSGWDVMLTIPTIGQLRCPRIPAKRYFIEIKPCIGDDYPCILRKMKAMIRSAQLTRYPTEDTYSRGDNVVLIVDKFESKHTSFEQLKNIFAQSDINVVKFSEVEATLL